MAPVYTADLAGFLDSASLPVEAVSAGMVLVIQMPFCASYAPLNVKIRLTDRKQRIDGI